MSSSQDSHEQTNARKHSTEDWMQVLDNFLDHHHQDDDEAGDESQHEAQNDHYHHQHHPHQHQPHFPPPRNSSSRHLQEDSRRHQDSTNSATFSYCQDESSHKKPKRGVTDDLDSSVHENHAENIDSTEGAEGSFDEKKAQIRSERKRTREKQRRSDVNSQFAALTDILKRVEGYDLDSDVSEDEEEGETKKRKVKTVGIVNVVPSNRVDLIARTVAIMERLHKVNRTLRGNVKNLRKTVKKVSASWNEYGDDLKKPSMNSTMGFGHAGAGVGMMNHHGQFPGGMMMMMAPPSMMGQSMQSGDGQQQQQQQPPMMMIVPMMMPHQMMNGNSGTGGMMPYGMNPPYSYGNHNSHISTMMQQQQQPQPSPAAAAAAAANASQQQNPPQQQSQQQVQTRQQQQSLLQGHFPAAHNAPASSSNQPPSQQQQHQQQAPQREGNNSSSLPLNVVNQNHDSNHGMGNSSLFHPMSFEGMNSSMMQVLRSQSSVPSTSHPHQQQQQQQQPPHLQQQTQLQQQQHQQMQYNHTNMMNATVGGMNPSSATNMPLSLYHNAVANPWNASHIQEYPSNNVQGQGIGHPFHHNHPSSNSMSAISIDEGQLGGRSRANSNNINHVNSNENTSNHDEYGNEGDSFSYSGNLAHCA